MTLLGKGVLKICKQIYRRTPMPKCDFNKVTSANLMKSNFGMGFLL